MKKKEYPFSFSSLPHGRWFYLSQALFLLLILYPYIESVEYSRAPLFLTFLHSLVIIAIIYEVSFNWYEFALALLIGIPALVLFWLPDTNTILTLQFTLSFLLYLYAIIMILIKIIPQLEVDLQTVFGVISLYLLLGLAWSNIFHIIDLVDPQSFFVSSLNTHKITHWADYLYFSFVTLTTLGYGDIVPYGPQAKSAAMLEAITGVLFNAVIVAKTIGLYVSGVTVKKQRNID